MTRAQLCAYVYALQVDALERHLAAEMTGAVVALALGAQGERPDPGEARSKFDEWLASEPELPEELANPEQHATLLAVGLR